MLYMFLGAEAVFFYVDICCHIAAWKKARLEEYFLNPLQKA